MWDLEQVRKKHPKAEIVETTDKHPGWNEFFRYYELRLNNPPQSTVFYHRVAREGYERFNNDHRHLHEIRESVQSGS